MLAGVCPLLRLRLHDMAGACPFIVRVQASGCAWRVAASRLVVGVVRGWDLETKYGGGIAGKEP
jgi:hypothetical protein